MVEEKERKNKEKVNRILRERFTAMSDEERQVYRGWTAWDKLRYARDLEIYEKTNQSDAVGNEANEQITIPKKRSAEDSIASVPKKKKF